MIDDDNGSIDIRGADGPLRATTDNGSVHATGVRSETVSVDSDNGSVEIEMVTPPLALEATTDNGRVDVVLPDTPDAYAVDIDTDNGSERNDVRTDPTSSRTITVSSHNGNVTVRYPD